MVLTESHRAALDKILSVDEIIDVSHPDYLSNTETWSAQKNCKPGRVLRPRTLSSLQDTVKYLCDTKEINFAVRSGGVGSSSAPDVVLSMVAFDEFAADVATDSVVVGAGQTWGDVDRKLEGALPGYAVVGARTPYVGVGGSISSDISWLSSEFGLGSDPHNLIDAHVILSDGRAIWASTEPDLLWALRGGGGNFGVITAVKIKTYRYPSTICSCMIVFPDESLPIVSKAVADFTKRTADPKLALHVFIMDVQRRGLQGQTPKPGIAFLIYDAHGEEHAKSEAGFKWAFDIAGAMVASPTANLSIRQVNNLQADTRAAMGMNGHLSAATTDLIDDDLLIRCWKWWETVVSSNASLGIGSFALLEIMQKPAFTSSGGESETAWPHDKPRHILQLSTASPVQTGYPPEMAAKILQSAPAELLLHHKPSDFLPNFLEDFNDLAEIFGPNYDRLRRLKTKYDPDSRFNKGFFIPPFIKSNGS